MKQISLQYFAILREQRGVSTESIQTASPDAAGIYRELQARHHFSLPMERVRVAINGEFAAWETPLADGASLVFIPPVAGG